MQASPTVLTPPLSLVSFTHPSLGVGAVGNEGDHYLVLFHAKLIESCFCTNLTIYVYFSLSFRNQINFLKPFLRPYLMLWTEMLSVAGGLLCMSCEWVWSVVHIV